MPNLMLILTFFLVKLKVNIVYLKIKWTKLKLVLCVKEPLGESFQKNKGAEKLIYNISKMSFKKS